MREACFNFRGRQLCFGAFLVLFGVIGCRPEHDNVVVVYTSQDQIYAEQILADFTRETGVKVLPLFDSESAKTAGLMNRLVAERARPRCDVFWSNEEMMVRRLGRKGVIDSERITTFGYRTRRLVINTNYVQPSDLPLDLQGLTDPRWKGHVAMAYPLFGTTTTHFMALRAVWGKEVWERWCRDLVENEIMIVDGNSAVVRLVGQGEAWLGLTDYDDVAVGIRNDLPVKALPMTPEFAAMANSVALVHGGPHRKNARRFVDYLQQRESQERLVDLGALEGVDMGELSYLRTDWVRVINDFDEVYSWLKETFLR
ncbi:MAG: Iron deficiency-induced protein A [Verrucomicrobia subdivision 3 bacterium]|nr:Iron deficiency-induced protein A [Limisphaerales bacterium]MCS1417381.1 Iron deficiency-induced protein A [Limisphaerales bacterium]